MLYAIADALFSILCATAYLLFAGGMGVMAGYACCIKLNGLLALSFLSATVFLLGERGLRVVDRLKRSLFFYNAGADLCAPLVPSLISLHGQPDLPFSSTPFWLDSDRYERARRWFWGTAPKRISSTTL